MSRKFEEVMDVLDYNELMRFKSDLDSGAISIKRLLEERIKKKLKPKNLNQEKRSAK